MYAKVILIACLLGLAQAGRNLGLLGLTGGLGYAGQGLGYGAGLPGASYGHALAGNGLGLGYGANPGFGYGGRSALGYGLGSGLAGNGALLSEHRYSITQPPLNTYANAYGAGFGNGAYSAYGAGAHGLGAVYEAGAYGQGAYKVDVYGANYASAGW